MTEKKGRVVTLTIQREAETVTIEGLRIRAAVRKFTAEAALNSAVIEITNASRDFQKFIARPILIDDDTIIRPPYDTIFLRAGYTDQAPIVFQGTIFEAITARRTSTDWTTRITAYTYLEQAKLEFKEKSYRNAYPLTIILDLFKAFKWPEPRLTPKVTSLLVSGSPLSSYTVSGSAFRSILTILAKYEMQLSISEEGPIIIHSGEEFDTGPDSTLPLISTDNGMIGSPDIGRTGIDVQTLLEPGIHPLRSFVCESDSLTATLGVNRQRYKAMTVEHLVTNRDREFYTKIFGAYPYLSTDDADIEARPGLS